jgi:thiosulfate/3-mercaptopyruvate sulfurtransferase
VVNGAWSIRSGFLVVLPGFAVWLLAASPTAAQAPRLISTDALANWLAGSEAPVGVPAGSAPVVVDVRQAWTTYLQNHLPGAGWLNVETLRAQQGELPFQLLPAEHYATLFTRLGISPVTPVVIYSAGDQSDVDATFTAWLLASAGAQHVHLLDGGYAKWEIEGRPVTQRYPRVRSPRIRFRPKAFRPPVARLEDVLGAVGGSGALLVDARPPEQFTGAAGAQLRRGHIPGAINHPWRDDLEKPDLALAWKQPEALRQDYVQDGITPDKDIILYCNTGTEASHVFFALRYLLDYPRVRIFIGSWTQWAEREELPVER